MLNNVIYSKSGESAILALFVISELVNLIKY